jgi:hypothetical protein
MKMAPTWVGAFFVDKIKSPCYNENVKRKGGPAMKRMSASDIILLVLKILVILAVVCSFVAMTVVSFSISKTIIMYDWVNEDNPSYHSGTGLAYFLGGLLQLQINIVAFAINAISLVVACLCKGNSKRKKSIRFFAWMFLPPVIHQALYLVLLPILDLFH